MSDDRIKFSFCELATNSENFILCIAHADAAGKAHVDLLDCHVPPFDHTKVVRSFAETLRQQGLDRVMVARFASRWPVELFARAGVAVEFAEAERPDIHKRFLDAVDAKRVALPAHAEFQAQLRALRRWRVGHGAPDDLLTAVAGATLAALGDIAAIVPQKDFV